MHQNQERKTGFWWLWLNNREMFQCCTQISTISMEGRKSLAQSSGRRFQRSILTGGRMAESSGFSRSCATCSQTQKVLQEMHIVLQMGIEESFCGVKSYCVSNLDFIDLGKQEILPLYKRGTGWQGTKPFESHSRKFSGLKSLRVSHV